MTAPARRPSALRVGGAGAAALATLLVAGCGGGSASEEPARPEAMTSYTAESPVLVPGRPGEAPQTLAPGETGTLENSLAYGDADLAFVRDMVPHHAQALEMAGLAKERAVDERVRQLADRIAAVQDPEVAAMQAWLTGNGLPEADDDHEGHTGMPGMATQEQLFALGQAEGEAFDRLFLQLMTRHHEGAVQMADAADVEVRSSWVTDLARDVRAEQAVEIGRLQTVLQDL